MQKESRHRMIPLLTAEETLQDLLGLGDLEPLKGGRTNRVWRSGEDVIKLYKAGSQTPLFENSPQDEWTVLSHLKGLNIAPTAVKKQHLTCGNILIYKYISGDFGYVDVADAARLLGTLHSIEPPQNLPIVQTGKAVLSHGAGMIPKGHELHDLHPKRSGDSASAFIHRDPVFSNFIASSQGLRLVDWQCPGIGDPVEDLAHFISPGMNFLYGGGVLEQAQIDRFLAHYPHKEIVERYLDYGQSYHWRMACYCAWQVEEGNASYVPALSAERDFIEQWSQS